MTWAAWIVIGLAWLGVAIESTRALRWRREARRRTRELSTLTSTCDRLLATLNETVTFVQKADCSCPKPRLPFMARQFMCLRCRVLQDVARRHDLAAEMNPAGSMN